MKKSIAIALFLTLTILFTTSGSAEWVLYDDFDSYTDISDLDPNKWLIRDRVDMNDPGSKQIAIFSIEGGRLRIKHLKKVPGISAWATLIHKPDKIKGISARMEVQKWEHEVRARIGADIGFLEDDPDHFFWYQFAFQRRPEDILNKGSIFGALSVLDSSNNYEWLWDSVYSQFGYPVEPVLDESYELTGTFTVKKFSYKVDDWGTSVNKYPDKIVRITDPFRGIGTISFDKDGTCVIYIDDVYVLR